MASSLRDGHVHLEASLRRRDARRHPEPADGFASAVLGCVCERAKDGAVGALIRFNPIAWLRRGVPLEVQRRVLRETAEGAAASRGLTVHWFVTLKRGAGPQEWEAAVDAGAAARDAGVIGVDVSRSYAVDDADARPAGGGGADRGLASAVARAREADLAVAAHCGWYDGRAELEEALGWGATRIGHGTPLVAAPDLVAELSRRGVTVEVCPTAFEQRTGRRLDQLPVEDWLTAGIGVDVGTDHPLALGTDLRTEARKLGEAFPAWRAVGPPAGVASP